MSLDHPVSGLDPALEGAAAAAGAGAGEEEAEEGSFSQEGPRTRETRARTC